MSESKRRGTFEQRKAEAIAAGRRKGVAGHYDRAMTTFKKIEAVRAAIKKEEGYKISPDISLK